MIPLIHIGLHKGACQGALRRVQFSAMVRSPSRSTRARVHAGAGAAAWIAALLSACASPPDHAATDGGAPAASPATFRLADGTFDVVRDGVTVFSRATADALVADAEGNNPRTVSFTDPCERRQEGEATFVCETGGVELRLAFAWAGDDRRFTAQLSVTNRSDAPIVVLKTAPLVVDAAHGGALRLGSDPARHRILENGRFVAFDATAQLEAGDVPRFYLGNVFPIPLRGNSVSNWNHLVADLDDPRRSLVAGFLTFERSVPTLGIGYDSAAWPDAFSTYAAECPLIFHGKRLAPGEAVASELLYVDPLPPDPLGALEDYATALADHLGVTPWSKRGPGHGVPNGWNSWTGGAGTGGYGQSIDESLILANLDVYRREFAPFGGSWFQVDDGWQVARGDWRWRPDAFPEGGPWMASTLSEAGFAPGLWLAPLVAAPESALAAEHPEWLMPPEDGVVGAFALDRQALDPSNPEVLAFLHDLFAGLRADGWRWAKVDFAYYALLGRPQHDSSLTNVEAYRLAWQAMRDGLGPDAFLLGVGTMGTLAGIVDGMRLTLDNGPRWDEDSPGDVLSTPRAFKATVRTGTRRWYFQNRLWVNHDDLIFFRSWPGGEHPSISFEEARTFATWIGLMGSIVKPGERLVDMEVHPAWIDVVRRLLPSWPEGARPLDVLLRDYPEQYRLHVVASAGEWDVVGLINWGTNRDWSENPPTAMAETTRSYTVTCDGDCLAYEFWSETFLGRKSGTFSVDVDPRRAKVLALRTPTGAPQLLGTNRHLTQGATDMGPLAWDAEGRTLSGTLTGAVGTPTAPWEYHLAFYLPAGFTLDHAEVDTVASPTVERQSDVALLKFSLPPSAQGEPVAFRLVF